MDATEFVDLLTFAFALVAVGTLVLVRAPLLYSKRPLMLRGAVLSIAGFVLVSASALDEAFAAPHAPHDPARALLFTGSGLFLVALGTLMGTTKESA